MHSVDFWEEPELLAAFPCIFPNDCRTGIRITLKCELVSMHCVSVTS